MQIDAASVGNAATVQEYRAKRRRVNETKWRDGLHLRGTVVMSVAVDTGEVTCIESVSGHPIMISAAMESFRSWKFCAYVAGGRKKRVLREDRDQT
jgi:hypothetical protein